MARGDQSVRPAVRLAIAIGLLAAAPGAARAQQLRFSTHRDVAVPDYATMRIGPFYSSLSLSESAGIRYSAYSGSGEDFYLDNDLGRITEEGLETPLVSELTARNYLLINRSMDLDLSFRIRYAYFPMDTQEDEFSCTAIDPGIIATFGGFTFRATEDEWYGGYQADAYTVYATDERMGSFANLDLGFNITRFLRGLLYFRPAYRTDYVDTRGRDDSYGGERYEYFQSVAGLDLDWLMAEDKNLALSVSRTDTIPSSNDYDEQESIHYRETARYEQQLGRNTVGGARANFVNRLYPDGDRGDTFEHDYSLFAQAQVTASTRMGGSVGMAWGEIDEAGSLETEDSFDTVVGSFLLATELSPRLNHQADYSRWVRGGYRAGMEIVDEYHYALRWKNDWIAGGYALWFTDVQQEMSTITDYRDWLHQLSLFYPLTRFVTLSAVTQYGIRDEDEGPSGAVDAIEETFHDDYETWTTRLGTTFHLTKRLVAAAVAEHVERFSDSDDVAFTRDTVALTCTYTYDF